MVVVGAVVGCIGVGVGVGVGTAATVVGAGVVRRAVGGWVGSAGVVGSAVGALVGVVGTSVGAGVGEPVYPFGAQLWVTCTHCAH